MSLKSSQAQFDEWLEQLIRSGKAPLASCPDGGREKMADFGVQLDSDYAVLAPSFQSLSAENIVQSMTSAPLSQWRINCLPFTASTNTTLIELAEQQSIAGAVVTADLQVSGKGRRGRPWVSPIGYGVAVSVGFEPDLPAHKLMGLSLVVGVSVAKSLSALGVPGARLKWPNDVLLGGAKLAGILVEVASTDPLKAVIGIGINVGNESLADPQVDQPTSNLKGYPHITRAQLVGSLLASLSLDLTSFEREGFGPFREEWESLHEYQGKSVTLFQADQEIHGVVRGVGLSGQLELATESGLREFVAGEVSLRARKEPSP